ncbi:heterokaryon incompatibility protein-domain-containing protein [Xylaria sp. FL1777]|nr:heterokaryon incompatibility protein-domain-containing protein [Xylaria sp. FL1777]
MKLSGALFDVTFGELCTGAVTGCQLFNWIMNDEWISQETIQSIARRDIIDNPKYNKLNWAYIDWSLWHNEWLGEPCPDNTLHKIRPSLGDSLDQCRLWASTYRSSANPLDIEFIEFFGLWDPITKKIVYRTRHGFQVFAHSEDPSSSTVSNRPIARFPGSGTNLVRMASWLNDCQEHHPNCRTMLGEMPTRLIEITDTSETVSLRLCRTKEVGRVPFAALSYCWGGEQPMKCLSSNIVSYGTTIPFEKQTQTIKDVIKVCQGIGLQYLWVDALCIIQDDPNDKYVEIAKMTSIYSIATVTIIAARSSSTTEGFLGERFPDLREGAVVSYRCVDGEFGSVTLVKLSEEYEEVEPIDERGWTLQERLLSSRIIEFGSRQTRWICSEIRNSGLFREKYTDGWRRDLSTSGKRSPEVMNLEHIRAAKSTIDFYGRPRHTQFMDYFTAMQQWENICATFTGRALTLSSDRALAVSGIAQIYAEVSGDQYFAGLWKSCFHSGLLWETAHNHLHHKNIPLPTTYQGPSWSWLSVNGPVRFGLTRLPSDCVGEIISCETEPANEAAPYGLVREGSGRLVLAAPTATAIRTRVPLSSTGRFKDEVMIIGLGPESLVCYAIAEMYCDVQGLEIGEEEEAADCLVAAICRTPIGGKLSCEGLVLRWSSPERKTYSRIGRFSYYGDRKGHILPEYVKEGQSTEVDFDWFMDELQVIEII